MDGGDDGRRTTTDDDGRRRTTTDDDGRRTTTTTAAAAADDGRRTTDDGRQRTTDILTGDKGDKERHQQRHASITKQQETIKLQETCAQTKKRNFTMNFVPTDHTLSS